MTGAPLLAVLDYGIGNLRSAEKALQHIGADARLSADPDEVAGADGVVLPGVGNFGRCIDALRRSGLDRVEGFTTAVLADVDREGGALRLLNRGHPAPVLLGSDGAARTLHPHEHALPLGMGELGTWPDELLEVSGIGEATLEKLRAHVTL